MSIFPEWNGINTKVWNSVRSTITPYIVYKVDCRVTHCWFFLFLEMEKGRRIHSTGWDPHAWRSIYALASTIAEGGEGGYFPTVHIAANLHPQANFTTAGKLEK